MAVEAEAGMEEMISLIEDNRDGDIKKGELYHKLGGMNQGTLAKVILILLTPKFGKESDLWVRLDEESVWWKEGSFQRYSVK
jgi:hypothetical protein